MPSSDLMGPITWLGGVGAGGLVDMDTMTDPLLDTALTTAKLDTYHGVIITAATTSFDQTFGAPTTTTPGKRYWVINNDTSALSFDVIGARTITIDPGEAEQFMWDGDAWIHITAADAEDITFNPAVSWATLTNIQSAWDEVHTATGLWMGASNSIYTTGNATQLYLATGGQTLFGHDTSISTGEESSIQLHNTAGLGFSISRWNASSGSPTIRFAKSRSATIGTNSIVLDNDELSTINSYGDDGANLDTIGTIILSRVDGTPSSNKMPTEFEFWTALGAVNNDIAISAKLRKDAMLDLYGGTISILAGADSNAKTRGATSRKLMRFAVPHYTLSEFPMSIILADSDTTTNTLTIGGGTSTMNAATSVLINAAGDATTHTGTEVARFEGGAAKMAMMGLGQATLKAWTIYDVLRIGNAGGFGSHDANTLGGRTWLAHNGWYDGDWKYINTASEEAARYSLGTNGTHIFETAVAGTEENVITWINALTIANDASSTFGGDVIVGGASATASNLLYFADTGGNEYHMVYDAGTFSIVESGIGARISIDDGLTNNINLTGGLTVSQASTFSGDVYLYQAVNDGNPFINIGVDATETLKIVSSYASGTQSLEYVQFNTYTASATADRGEYIFSVDQANILKINDSGLNLYNGMWLQSIDNAGTGVVNMFSLDADDSIHVGAKLVAYHGIDLGGGLEAEADSGAISLFNMPVTSTPSAGDEMSVSVMIDSEVMFKCYSEADGTGGIQNKRIELGTGVTFGGGGDYGELYISSSSAETTTTGWTDITGSTWTLDEASEFTASDPDLISTNGGVFHVSWSLSSSAGTINDIYEVGISVNGADPTTQHTTRRKYGGVGDIGVSAGTIIVTLTAGQTLNLMHKRISGSGSMTALYGTLTAVAI